MAINSPYSGKIKIFSDGADRKSMLEMAANPVIKGITTNPSLMKKAGIKDYRTYCKEILAQITDKPISFEVLSNDFGEMRKQALEIASWGENVYVKIPIINEHGHSAAPLIRELTMQKVKVNVTAITVFAQVLEACTALKGGAPSYVSVFAGRIADTGRDPMPLMISSVEVVTSMDKSIELIWASTREAYNIVQAEQIGCQIITVPPDVIKKLPGFNKDTYQLSLETVRIFKADTESAGFTL
jgi:transaldolase